MLQQFTSYGNGSIIFWVILWTFLVNRSNMGSCPVWEGNTQFKRYLKIKVRIWAISIASSVSVLLTFICASYFYEFKFSYTFTCDSDTRHSSIIIIQRQFTIKFKFTFGKYRFNNCHGNESVINFPSCFNDDHDIPPWSVDFLLFFFVLFNAD